MIQLKEVNSSSAEDVKSQTDLYGEQKHPSQLNTISIENKETLIQSLRKSFQKSKEQQKCKMGNISKIFNTFSYFFEALWNQIVPSFFRPKPEIKVMANRSQFFSVLKRKGNLIDQGSISFCLDVCHQKKRNFIIIVYEEEQNLFKLQPYIKQKIKDYVILPINRHNQTQLSYLSIQGKTSVKTTLYICRFNFASELTIFYEIDAQNNQEDFNALFAVAQLSINDYLEFQEQCLNNFRENQHPIIENMI